MRRFVLAVLGLVISCSSQDRSTIALVTGGETDTFTAAPVPKTLEINAVQSLSDGGSQTSLLATATLPATSIDLGNEDESAEAVITVTGLDADGGRVLQGESLLLHFSSIAGGTFPVFVQRNGQFARLPGPLNDARPLPTLAILQGQYLFVGAGADPALVKTSQLYDFMQLAPLGKPPALPTAPQSIALDGTIGWLIDDIGGAYFDFSDSASVAIPLPSGGGTFADIAGGQTVADQNGAQYIVGATRTTGDPTPWILKIDPNDSSNGNYPYGNATWQKLFASRLGAAGAWVTGSGLVVAGGSATAPGAELVSETGAVTALPYAPDGSVGAGATAVDAQHVVLAGGVLPGGGAGVRVIDILGCGGSTVCTPTTWPDLSVALSPAQAFSLSGASVLVVGNEASLASDGSANPNAGATHVFSVSGEAAVEIATKVAHRNARAIVSPIGTLLVVGGAAEIESFVP